MLDKWNKKEKPIFTGISRGIGGFSFGSASDDSEKYWIATMGINGLNDDPAQAVVTDSLRNVYACGPRGTSNGVTVKCNSLGVVQWQRELSGVTFYDIALDSSDNVYVVGFTSGSGSAIIAKYNSSGTIQWQRTLSSANIELGFGVQTDSSDNVYICGRTSISGSNNCFIAKYNSSGTIQWQRTLSGAGSSLDQFIGIEIDSSDNVYTVGSTLSSGDSSGDLLIVKYNSSGTIQWQRRLDGNGDTDSGLRIAIDSSDNVYVIGDTVYQTAGVRDMLFAKYNSSGTIQWQRTLGSSSYDYGYSIATDSSDNVYITGKSDNYTIIAKYNSSGTVQWQRKLMANNTTTESKCITLDNLNNVYVCGNASPGNSKDWFIIKVPNDGSLTGTYWEYSYSIISSLTDSSSSLTDSSTSLTDASSSLTDASSSITESAASFVSYVTDVS